MRRIEALGKAVKKAAAVGGGSGEEPIHRRGDPQTAQMFCECA
jgi:hypothetical protein